jgi:hypothetical protein
MPRMSENAWLIALVSVLAVGCAPPPDAPTELEELSTFLFEEFESEADVLGAGLVNLDAFFAGWDEEGALAADTGRAGREWSLPNLELSSMEGLDRAEDINPVSQLPVALAMRSVHPGQDHTNLIGLADQTPVEADTSESYIRTYETDLDCFLDGSCDRLECTDAIHRLSPGVLDLNYEQNKHYRHIPYGEDGAVGVVSRSWVPRRYENDEDPPDYIDQWFGLNIYLPQGDTTIRYSALWGASSLNLDDDFLVNQVAAGIDEAFQNTETYLAAN